MRTKRRWPSIVLGVALVVVAGLFVFGKYEFTMTEAQIQEKVVEALPIEKDGVTIDDVVVDLADGQNHVTIEASGTATKFDRTYAFTLRAAGVPEYKFTTGDFYFRATDVEIVSLEQSEGETTDETVGRIGSLVKDLFPQRADAVDELQYAAEQLAPQVQAWLEGRATGVVTYVLQRTPIYTLPDDEKGYAAQAVLDDVRIENESLVVELSLKRLGIWVLLFGFAGLLSLAYGMIFVGFLTYGARN